jgi:hypothetical protein
MMMARIDGIDEILARNGAVAHLSDSEIGDRAPALADGLLADGERILEIWIAAQGDLPTTAASEGFRLLALHRQGARGNPSFNACRETCREIVYHRNVVVAQPDDEDTPTMIRRGAMVVTHLALFIGGKLEVSGLGDFCCSSRPIRQAEPVQPQDSTPRNSGGHHASR